MNSAPRASALRNLPANPNRARASVSSPELDAIQAAFERQNHELEMAFTTLSACADTPLAVRAERLLEIDEACVNRRASAPELFVLTRC